MEPSALEKELLHSLYNFKSFLRAHDRGVIMGCMLSCVPVPPVTALGLLVGVANKHLLKKGKLDIYEKGLVRAGLWIGTVNLILGFLAVFFLFKLGSSVEWGSLLAGAKEQLSAFFDFIKSHLNFFQTIEQQQGEPI